MGLSLERRNLFVYNATRAVAPLSARRPSRMGLGARAWHIRLEAVRP